jgi:hypothetical protein
MDSPAPDWCSFAPDIGTVWTRTANIENKRKLLVLARIDADQEALFGLKCEFGLQRTSSKGSLGISVTC